MAYEEYNLKNKLRQKITNQLNKTSIITDVTNYLHNRIEQGLESNPNYILLNLFDIVGMKDKLNIKEMKSEYNSTIRQNDNNPNFNHVSYGKPEYLYSMTKIPYNLEALLLYFKDNNIKVSIHSFASETTLILKLDLT